MTKTNIVQSLHLTDYPQNQEDPYPLSYLVIDNQDLVFLKIGPVMKLGRPASLTVEIDGAETRRIDAVVDLSCRLNTYFNAWTDCNRRCAG